MIATVTPARSNTPSMPGEERFLEMLPLIRSQAWAAFRHLAPGQRDELVAEVLAKCWVAFVALMERGRQKAIHATPLARYAIKQTRAGRRVGGQRNARDVTSFHCQTNNDIRVEQLDHVGDPWKDILIEDRCAGPAETAAIRIDYGEWLNLLPPRQRRIANTLATGEKTGQAAREFGVTHGRIAQIRKELRQSWEAFQGETPCESMAHA